MLAPDPESVEIARYDLAAAFIPQRFSLALAGAVGDGYWIDDHRYFCTIAELLDGRLRMVPCIADPTTGRVDPVVPIDVLAETIGAHTEKPITSAEMSTAQYDMPNAGTLVVVLGAEAYHVEIAGPTLTKSERLDPMAALYSPDGAKACFRRDGDVWIKDRTSGVTEQLTVGGEPLYAYGSAPESGTAPLLSRKMPVPVGLWSQDSQWFVTHRVDERGLPDAGLVEHAPAGGGRPVAHIFKVAGPDVDPPSAEYVAYHIPSGRTVRASETSVIAPVFSPFTLRQCWLTEDVCYFFDWDRFNAKVSLMALDLGSGAVRTVLSEAVQEGWIEFHPMIVGQPMIRPLPSSQEIVWYSQADGRGHLYLHDLTSGELKNRITAGEWVVREIVHVDEAGRRIMFLASGFDGDADPGNRRLCAIDFDGTAFETIFAADGDFLVKPDPVSGVEQYRPFRPSYAPSGASADGRYVIGSLGNPATATRTLLIDVAAGRESEIARLDVEAIWAAPKPERFEVMAADGVTRLIGAMHFPSDFDPSRTYPLVDYIYPGPQMNWLTRRFPNATALTLQSVVELGMVGIVLETRGMPNRDRAFHQAGHGRLHEPQLADHAAAIEQLCARHAFLDRTRVGIFGQSGGGYATARALFDYPEVFKVGVSVCGNHDSRNYVGYWLDKYGGRPGTRERDEQANTSAATKLQGKLLLMHGDMDDNVHPGHSLALSAALIAAGKEFDQLIVPGATHGILNESPYAMQRLWTYFVRHLLKAEPPTDFKLDWSPAGIAAARAMSARDMA